MTSPSPARSLASIPSLLSRSERRPMWCPALIPSCGIKFHLQIRLPQAICGHKPRAPALLFARISIAIRAEAVPENGMPDIKIVTEVAGRVCALPVEIGGSVGDGDDIVFVEAMKMEIPVAAPAAGKLKSILVSLDDVVAEGQVLAILET